MVFRHPQGHEDSEYMLSFEIGQRESGFYSGWTDGHTDILGKQNKNNKNVKKYQLIKMLIKLIKTKLISKQLKMLTNTLNFLILFNYTSFLIDLL